MSGVVWRAGAFVGVGLGLMPLLPSFATFSWLKQTYAQQDEQQNKGNKDNKKFVFKHLPDQTSCAGCEIINKIVKEMNVTFSYSNAIKKLEFEVVQCVKNNPCVLKHVYEVDHEDHTLFSVATKFGWVDVLKTICTPDFRPVLHEAVNVILKTYTYKTERTPFVRNARMFLFERYPQLFDACQKEMASKCKQKIEEVVWSYDDDSWCEELEIEITTAMKKRILKKGWCYSGTGRWLANHTEEDEFRDWGLFDCLHQAFYKHLEGRSYLNMMALFRANIPFWSSYRTDKVVEYIITMNNTVDYHFTSDQRKQLVDITYNLVRCNPEILTLLEKRLPEIKYQSKLYLAIVSKQL